MPIGRNGVNGFFSNYSGDSIGFHRGDALGQNDTMTIIAESTRWDDMVLVDDDSWDGKSPYAKWSDGSTSWHPTVAQRRTNKYRLYKFNNDSWNLTQTIWGDKFEDGSGHGYAPTSDISADGSRIIVGFAGGKDSSSESYGYVEVIDTTTATAHLQNLF